MCLTGGLFFIQKQMNSSKKVLKHRKVWMSMIKFQWKKAEKNETLEVKCKGHRYKIIRKKLINTYYIHLYEDGESIMGENTENNSFRRMVNVNLPLEEQILQWGNKKLEELKDCPKCGDIRFVISLSEYDLATLDFQGFKEMCIKCRLQVIHDKHVVEQKKRTETDQKFKQEYEKKPPIILGFKAEKYARRYLDELSNPDVETLEGGFILAKGIIKANNGRYYPVFLFICLQDSGELYGADFMAENYLPEGIELRFARTYIENLYPFKYKTLSRLAGDIHQENWPDFS